MTHITSTLAVFLLIAALAASCAAKLPPDPGLLGEDLGLGLTLGMSQEDAKMITAPDGLELVVASGEDVARSNPYLERKEGDDLVVAVVTTGSEQVTNKGAVVTDPVLTIKGFPRSTGPTQLKLFGKDVADLTADDVISRLGKPASEVHSNDGSTHLGYTFSSNQLARRDISATFSHHDSGRCYAFEISLSLLP